MLKKNQEKYKMISKGWGAVISLCLINLFVVASLTSAETGSIKEKQIIENNKSLKNAIEENQRMTSKFQELEDEMAKLKSENEEHSVRYDDLKRERDNLAKTIEGVRTSNRKYAQEVAGLEKKIEELEESQGDMLAKADAASSYPSSGDVSASPSSAEHSVGGAQDEVVAREQKTIDLLSRIDAFTEQDEQLRNDAAKAHYNMGNIYFEKGEYEIAAREFYQAVTLMPNDADAHYNLAFVSGEYLNDFKTALEHYKMYLFLKPDAKDKDAINEKIVHAQLILESKIESPLDQTK